jgi:hypothetical protein
MSHMFILYIRSKSFLGFQVTVYVSDFVKLIIQIVISFEIQKIITVVTIELLRSVNVLNLMSCSKYGRIEK